MKKDYQKPEMEVCELPLEDVIATSGNAQPTSENEEYETENANPIWF